MTTNRPDDRADVIEAATQIHIVICEDDLEECLSYPGPCMKAARALSDAGLLATPADQDNAADQVTANAVCHLLGERLRRAEAERDKLRADYAALVNSQLLTRYGELGTRLVRAEAENTELRATIDRVRGLADEWDRTLQDTLRVEIDELRAALDGGEQ